MAWPIGWYLMIKLDFWKLLNLKFAAAKWCPLHYEIVPSVTDDLKINWLCRSRGYDMHNDIVEVQNL